MIYISYELILERKNQIETEMEKIEKQLAQLPDMSICCSKNKNANTYRWVYYKDENHKGNISKKDLGFAQQLILRKYLLALKEDLSKEAKAIQSYLINYKSTHQVEKFFQNPEQSRLLQPYFRPIEEELAEWALAPYEKSTEHPENLVHEVAPDVFVRSKSESLIYGILQKYHIPFHYEEKLSLGSKVYYPDFKIRHPKTGKVYYWEHFGLMDDSNYRNNAISKIHVYSHHNILPFEQLILTYETNTQPLTMAKIEKIVKDFFL